MAEIKVVLVGGPSYFPDDQRVQYAPSLTETFKKRFRNGYEHFVHQGAFHTVEGEELPALEWTARTAIAE
ncbi:MULTISPECIES: DUF5988 family protein [Streptomyces]|uniref:DUF5988 family protein n=1 Tax=Streptomyces yunnanensis TaxID=156453 RepID=A0ABY8ALK1_9ACTN|nr:MULTISPECIES: DUF5988 family protein [Streptomyces]AJC52700.1 hypothetical protein GZL_00092 [Streptomyces sp. 769]AJC61839.1 hypothetical protein GZL_09321 [Streptomyces sp. 769]WEB45496.1 DUF5988 family protein [Streptomyces yunnanensis]